MLSHRYPRVRRFVAENLYILLLERPDLVQGDNQTLEKSLLEEAWDADLNERKISDMVSIVSCGLGLGVLSPKSVYEEQEKVFNKPLADEFATYAALVHSTQP